MKKLLLVFTLALGAVFIGNAQEVGARFGNVSGGNVAVDAIFSLAKFSRLHADVSFGNGVGLDLLWDFLYRPLPGEAFHWYVGVGPGFVFDDPFQFGAMGEVGLEYKFNQLPIVLGIDWRPFFRFVENTDFDAGGFGFNVRYVFGGGGGGGS